MIDSFDTCNRFDDFGGISPSTLIHVVSNMYWASLCETYKLQGTKCSVSDSYGYANILIMFFGEDENHCQVETIHVPINGIKISSKNEVLGQIKSLIWRPMEHIAEVAKAHQEKVKESLGYIPVLGI